MKKPPALQLEEIPGDRFPDLDAAWRAALPALSEDLQAVIQQLLECGELVRDVDGKIIPNPSRFRRNGTPKVEP